MLLGIPKPLHAELFDEPERRRVAYFSNGKRFFQEDRILAPLESYDFTFRADSGFKWRSFSTSLTGLSALLAANIIWPVMGPASS